MFIIDDIIAELVSQGVVNVQDQLNRNEKAIKLLKKFNLKSNEPPPDFEGIYVYTLIEYGICKPQLILELFRAEPIQSAFQEAFEQNNPNLLLKKTENFINNYLIGSQVKSQQIDYRRELAEFSAIFIKVIERTRTPKEILEHHQLKSLQNSLNEVRQQLEPLNLIEIKTQLAQLSAGYQQLLPPVQTKDSPLAQQMRGWFTALKYDFESSQICEKNYFEWVINIPARRGFDRILVRGIEGEAGLDDLQAVRQSVDEQKTDEGWLVSHRRISRAARNEVEKRENQDLFCYTFDELLDEVADFSGYFDWLEQQVKSRSIDRAYVPLACTKEEIDPQTKQRIGSSRYDERDGWIEGYIDLWLDDPAKEHLSVLGEFGTGKTWFAFHYAWVALQAYLKAKNRGVERPRLPLVIPLRDYAKAVSVESLFSEFFFRKHEIKLPGYSAFEQLNRMGKLLLIFDGFDEMAARVDRQAMINNFWELAKVVVPGSKAILTCRTEHFPEAKEGRSLLNAELKASTANLTGETPQFEVLELEKFSDKQIQQVLLFCGTGEETVNKVMVNPQLLDLARRPVMVDLILEALPEIEAGKPVDISRVYLYAVQRKMQRDIKTERTFTSMADKLYFLCELSWEMLSTDQMSLNYKEFPDRIRRLFSDVVQEQQDLDHWQYDMMGQTMLIRNSEGDYTPAHRSLLEFFVAYKFAAELGILAQDFLEIPSLYQVISLENLSQTFGQTLLTKAVIDLILPMLDSGNQTRERLLEVINWTKGKTEQEVKYTGGNAVTLLLKNNSSALENCDLSRSVIIGADFTQARLRNVNFTQAIISQSIFTTVLGFVWSVAFSPDDKFLATADSDGVHLWDAKTGQALLNFQGHTNRVYSVAFSPDGQMLASGSADRTVKIWNTQTGECLKTLKVNTSQLRCITFSPNGQFIASKYNENSIILWDIQTGDCLKNLPEYTGRSMAFSPCGRFLIGSSTDQTIKIYNLQTEEYCQTLQHSNEVHSVLWSPDGQFVATRSTEGEVKLWDFNTGECFRTITVDANFTCAIAISPDAENIVTGSRDGILQVWSIKTGECLKQIQAHTNEISTISFSKKANIFASGSIDQTVKTWDIETEQCLITIQGISDWIRRVILSSSGRLIASGNDRGKVSLFNFHTGEYLKTFDGHTAGINSILFIHSDRILVTGSGDHTIKLWEIETGQCLQTLQGHQDWICFMAFINSEGILVSGSDDGVIKFWNLNTGDCTRTFETENNSLKMITSSESRQLFITGDLEGIITLWNLDTGEYINSHKKHRGIIKSMTFSLDNQILASGGFDNTIKLWNIDTGEDLITINGHTDWIHSLIFTSSGDRLVSASADHTIKIWDINTGECVKTLLGHTSPVYSVTLSPDNNKIVSGSGDRTIRIWDIHTGKCLNVISDRLFEGMNITEVKGLNEAEIATLKALGAVET